MLNKTRWLTNLGSCEIMSGELSPDILPFELRFYPQYGFDIDEWDFEYGIIKGNNPLEYLTKEDFIHVDNYFKLKIKFNLSSDSSTIRLFATHKRTKQKVVFWDGVILPNLITIQSKVTGLQEGNWNVFNGIKQLYPNINLKHFCLPVITINVESNSILVAKAGNIEEHVETNAPIVLKEFHPYQNFNLIIDGFVFGYGGMGGDAGISTITDEVDIIYPSDGLDGGNPIYVEYATQQVNVKINDGCFLAGKGGKGGSAFLINNPLNRRHQIGHPGLGGYPNGLNGRCSDVQYRLKLVKENTRPHVEVVNSVHYKFRSGRFIGHYLPNDISLNSCIKQGKDGCQGTRYPQGVVSIKEVNETKDVRSIFLIDGKYIKE